jgi:hypothetical protein
MEQRLHRRKVRPAVRAALAFLFPRLALVAGLMAAIAVLARAQWPRSGREVGHLIVPPLLVHGAYPGGIFVAIAGGMAAGLSAMLVGLPQLLTVLLARVWFNGRVVPREWTGLLLGLAGVYSSCAMKSISAATSQASCRSPLRWPRSASARRITSKISLLNWLLRHGAAAVVARLLYLVLLVTAAMAFALFGEKLDALALGGMALTAVAMARPHTARPGLAAALDAPRRQNRPSSMTATCGAGSRITHPLPRAHG